MRIIANAADVALLRRENRKLAKLVDRHVATVNELGSLVDEQSEIIASQAQTINSLRRVLRFMGINEVVIEDEEE